MSKSIVLQVAVPIPFRKLYDYLPNNNRAKSDYKIGARVNIPFGKSEKIGMIINITDHSTYPIEKLKPINELLDSSPIFEKEHLTWLKWISQYYHHPIGETIFTALPALLRKSEATASAIETHWRATELGKTINLDSLNRAKKQQQLLILLREQTDWISNKSANEQLSNWRPAAKALMEKNLVEQSQRIPNIKLATQTIIKAPELNEEQQEATNEVTHKIDHFSVFLLDGITGSGKTEVYFSCIEQVIKKNEQVLLLIPEIGLTPQLLKRFSQRFNCTISVLHSALNDSERYQIWKNAQNGQLQILIGTRSSIFTPFLNLGLIIIDEEHDLSFKQQDGLKYSARDVAITRAQKVNIPVILGSATPCLESLSNVKKGAYHHLKLRQRAGNAIAPRIDTIDLKGKELVNNFSSDLLKLIKQTLAKDEQVILFLNRRGFAPTMLCHECAWSAQCTRCDTYMTIHKKKHRLICHHCGSEKRIPQQCPSCSSIDLRPIGFGTERTEQALQDAFPDTEIIRIDRDTTSRKNAMRQLLEKIENNRSQILLGTQMLAKGHDFPNVTLVGILDADQGLFGTDMRSNERMAQLITQVAGRAGRGEKRGLVIIQTHHPDHPLLQTLINKGYGAFADNALRERQEAQLPPFSYTAMFRSEAPYADQNIRFLQEIKQICQSLNSNQSIELLGPIPSSMERKAGKYRAQLLLSSHSRKDLHHLLSGTLQQTETLKSAKRVRWSIDVDPQDMS